MKRNKKISGLEIGPALTGISNFQAGPCLLDRNFPTLFTDRKCLKI